MVGRGPLSTAVFLGGTDGSNPVPSSAESTTKPILRGADPGPRTCTRVLGRVRDVADQAKPITGANHLGAEKSPAPNATCRARVLAARIPSRLVRPPAVSPGSPGIRMSDDDTVTIGLAKLQLRPGDLLCVSVPDSWTGADVAAFETGLRCEFAELLSGVIVLVLPAQAQIMVRTRRDPQGSVALLTRRAASQAVN